MRQAVFSCPGKRIPGRRTRIRSGSVTIYFCLMMVVLVSFFCASILSVKVAAGRMQAANSVDQSMFSLFARYDRTLQSRYDLFFLDAGSGGGGPDLTACVTLLEEALEYGLKPNKGRAILGGRNLLRLKREGSAVTAYTLATDAGGIPFEAQAVQAARTSGTLDAVSLLKEKLTVRKDIESKGRELLEGSSDASYSDVQEAAREAAEEAEEAEEAEAEGGDDGAEEAEVSVPEGFINPLPVLYRLYRKKVMDVVVPDPGSISSGKADRKKLVSGRSLAGGMGVIDATGASDGLNDLYYIAWIIGHFGNYANPCKESVLTYQMEYLLKGKYSDKDNLTAVVRDLMKVRHAANVLCLYTDAEKSSELDLLAFFIGSVLFIPAAQPLIKAVLAVLWAYAESLVDVRALLEGKKVALVKDRDSWQTDPEDLAAAGGEIGGLTRDIPGGISYGEYLGTMILVMQRRTLTARAMDMVEATVRGMGKEDFRLDACIGAMAVEIRIESEGKVTFPVKAELSYMDL